MELKVGKFKPSDRGQMSFYLKWLDRYERQPDESSLIGLTLCTKTSRDQIELLELHKDGIVISKYWTTFPPRLSSKPAFRRSAGMRRSGSSRDSSPQRREKTLMSRYRQALSAASSAASSRV